MPISISNLKTTRTLEDLIAEIRDARKKYNLSQEDLALMVGISQPYLSKIEKGVSKDVPMNLVLSILEKLGIDIFIGKIEQTN